MSSIESLVAAELEQHAGASADRVMDRLREELPALLEGERRSQAALAGISALLTEFAVVLRLGLTQGFRAPPEAVAFARVLAHDGVPLAQLLRSYRLGQEITYARMVELMPQADEADPAAAVARMGLLSFVYSDAVMSDVATAFEEEHERVIRRDVARREEVLAVILAGGEIDVVRAEQVLGRRLGGEHVALVAWRVGRGDRLSDDVRAALDSAGVGRPLLVGEPAGSVAVWFTPPPAAASPPAWVGTVASGLAGTGVQAVYGDALRGIAGFARSYQQAMLAKSVVLAGASDAALTAYSGSGLASLLLRDADAARRFAAEELGELAGPRAVRERATLAAFYACAHDQSRTARALGVHRNTIARRLARAEEALGSDLADRVPERAAALRIVDSLPGGGS